MCFDTIILKRVFFLKGQMEVEKLVKEEDNRVEEEYEKLGIIRRGLKGGSSLFKVAAGSAPSEEEIERNKNTWEGRLFENHPYVSCGIIMGLLGITVSSGVYILLNVGEYLKDLYTK